MAFYQRLVGDCIVTDCGNKHVVASGAIFAPVNVVVWNSSGSTSWNTAANWSTGSVPGANDNVVFRETSTVNCTCDVAIDVASLTVTSGYSGTLDFANSSYSHAIVTDINCAGTGEVDLGISTITCGGSFRWNSQTTKTKGTAHLVLSGNGSFDGYTLHNVTVSGTYSRTATILYIYGTLTISGTLTQNIPEAVVLHANGAGVVIASGGEFTGNGTTALYNYAYRTSAGYVNVQSGGVWSHTGQCNALGGLTITSPCTLTGSWVFGSNYDGRYARFPSGTTTFTGNVEFQQTAAGNTTTVDLSTNNASVEFQGDVTVTQTDGTVAWSKSSTGSVTFSGTADQTITTPAGWTQTLDDITINKSGGRVDLAGNLYTDSLTFDDGDLDLNGYTIYSAGSVEVNGDTGARFWNGTDSDMSNGKIDIDSGTLTLTGSA